MLSKGLNGVKCFNLVFSASINGLKNYHRCPFSVTGCCCHGWIAETRRKKLFAFLDFSWLDCTKQGLHWDPLMVRLTGGQRLAMHMKEHGQILAAAGRSERERWGSGQKFWAIVTISWAETPPTFHLMCHRKFWCCSPNADWWMKRGRRLVRWVCICKTFDHTTQPACRSQEALMMVNGNQNAPLCPLFYAVMLHLPKILFYSGFPVQSSIGEKASPH